MQHSHVNKVAQAGDIGIGIVAPDGRQGMVEHAEQFASRAFLSSSTPDRDCRCSTRRISIDFVEQANWVAVNDYEWQLLQQKTGWTVRDLTQRVKALIVTRGHKGSVIYTPDGQVDIPCAQAAAVVDPTGCGDAYRAGLLHGFLHNLDYETTGRIAAVMGALKIESRGTQNHRATLAQLERRLAESFGDAAAAKAALSAAHVTSNPIRKRINGQRLSLYLRIGLRRAPRQGGRSNLGRRAGCHPEGGPTRSSGL